MGEEETNNVRIFYVLSNSLPHARILKPSANIWVPTPGSFSLIWPNGGLGCPIYYILSGLACVYFCFSFQPSPHLVIPLFYASLQVYCEVLISGLNSVSACVLLQFGMFELWY